MALKTKASDDLIPEKPTKRSKVAAKPDEVSIADFEDVKGLDKYRLAMKGADVFYVPDFVSAELANEWYDKLTELDTCTPSRVQVLARLADPRLRRVPTDAEDVRPDVPTEPVHRRVRDEPGSQAQVQRTRHHDEPPIPARACRHPAPGRGQARRQVQPRHAELVRHRLFFFDDQLGG